MILDALEVGLTHIFYLKNMNATWPEGFHQDGNWAITQEHKPSFANQGLLYKFFVETQTSNTSQTPHGSSRTSTLELWAWAFYEWARNVFAAYCTERVASDTISGTKLLRNTLGITGIVIALGGPILGAIADQFSRSKRWIAALTCLCVVFTALLWFIRPDPAYVPLAIFLVSLGTIASEFAMIFYTMPCFPAWHRPIK